MKKLIFCICACIQFCGIHAQIITTIAGSGPWFGAGHGAFSGDGGPATNAEFFQPASLAFDNIGNLYIADEYNFRIRKIDTIGIINTIAGTGVSGYGGDDSIATVAKFCDLGFIKIGYDGNLYIPDICNNRIRKITLATNIITTYAGVGEKNCDGDTGIATSAKFNYPVGITFDHSGNLYFGDGCNHIDRINEVGNMARMAGSDSLDACCGDGGPAIAAKFGLPADISFDQKGNLFISDLNNDIIRKIDTSGNISRYAGTDTTFGYYGNGGPATLAQLFYPEGIVTDGDDNIFFSDEYSVLVETRIVAQRIFSDDFLENRY